jgi:hypothetical protein
MHTLAGNGSCYFQIPQRLQGKTGNVHNGAHGQLEQQGHLKFDGVWGVTRFRELEP